MESHGTQEFATASLCARLLQFVRQSASAQERTLPSPPSPDALTLRWKRIVGGVEDGSEEHSYRGNREVDYRWPDERAKN